MHALWHARVNCDTTARHLETNVWRVIKRRAVSQPDRMTTPARPSPATIEYHARLKTATYNVFRGKPPRKTLAIIPAPRDYLRDGIVRIAAGRVADIRHEVAIE